MKTLLFTLEYPPFKGGVANYYWNIAKYWPDPEKIEILDNNDNKILKKFFYPKWLFAVFVLFKNIKKKKINHILVGHILPLGTIVYFLSKFMKIKYSVIIHGMDIKYAYKIGRKRLLATKILKQADNIICTNSYIADFIRINFDNKISPKISVVNPGINTDVEINYKRAEELKIKYRVYNNPLIFSIGRFVKRKGFDNMLLAMPEIQKYYPNLFYVLAGDGPDKEYIKNNSKGVSNVLFLGKISEEDKWAWLSICDIFAMPSREIEGDMEGFGIVYLEAGLCKKAVIGGNSGGVKDAVISAITGILTDPNNVEKIANSTLILLNDENTRKKMGTTARERILKNFSATKQVVKIYDIISK